MNELLEQQIQENLGMAMIYTIVTVLKEWLVEQVASLLLSLNCCPCLSFGQGSIVSEEPALNVVLIPILSSDKLSAHVLFAQL